MKKYKRSYFDKFCYVIGTLNFLVGFFSKDFNCLFLGLYIFIVDFSNQLFYKLDLIIDNLSKECDK